MRDYAELVTRLKQSDDNCNAECCECSGECLSSGCNIFCEAADAIEELLDELTTIRKQLPHWISVEERMPEKDETVIVYYSWTGQSGTEYRETSLATLDEMRYCGNKLLGWMPLPAPPKGVE